MGTATRCKIKTPQTSYIVRGVFYLCELLFDLSCAFIKG